MQIRDRKKHMIFHALNCPRVLCLNEKFCFKRMLLFIILMFSLCSSKAQLYSIARLDSQLVHFQVSFEGLMTFRGYSAYHSGTVDVPIVQQAIYDYNHSGFSNARYNQNEQTGMLFFNYANDTLSEWLLDGYIIRYYHATEIKEDKLLEMERNFKIALNASVPDQEVAKRGFDVLQENDSSGLAFSNNELCKLLFPDDLISKISKSQGNAKRIHDLFVIPALNIGSIPLYALKPYSNNSFLVDSLCLVVSYNIDDFIKKTKYCLDYKLPQHFPLAPVIIGNPSIGTSCAENYSPLPGAEKEAIEVATIFNSKALISKSATKENLLSALKNTDFIYLATHGHADANDPLQSYVLLASGNNDSCAYWTAKEIQSESKSGSLNQDIIVLSACQTGLGKVHNAGIIGLSRAFIIAGAWNVIMSLWSVDDKATLELMKLFAQELSVEHDFFPSENLRQAILKFKQQDSNPSHWAAFIGMGFPYPPGSCRNIKAIDQNK
jgi:hypothetical protein